MHQLTGRLTALDPDAGAALNVIPYFDELLAQHSGLESIVRGAAVLTGVAARLMTPSRTTPLRVLPDGRRADESVEFSPDWPAEELPECGVTMWLERPGEPGPVEAMVLERATQAARTVLDRTRGRYVEPRRHDDELVELLLDGEASSLERAHAIRTMGFRPGEVIQVIRTDAPAVRIVRANNQVPPGKPGERVGVGVAVPIENAPLSGRTAEHALRLSGSESSADPAPHVVQARTLGAVMLLVAGFDRDPSWADHPDVQAIAAAAQELPWLTTTLHALCSASSLRTAATALHIHHSTLQTRLARLCQELGWDVSTAEGKFRLQVALTVRQLAASPGRPEGFVLTP